MNGRDGMRRTVTVSALGVALLLLPVARAAAQDAADPESEFVIPTDGLFPVPEDVGWFHTYVDIWWLGPMVAVAALLLWVAKWINQDGRKLGIDPVRWNYLTMAVCLASLVVFFLVPPYLSLPASLLAVFGVLWRYIPLRNRKVLPSRQLFTAQHRVVLWKRFLRIFGIKSRRAEKRLARVAKTHLPVALFFQGGRVASAADAPPNEQDPATGVKEAVAEAAKKHARDVFVTPHGPTTTVSYKVDGLEYSGTPLDRLRGSAFVAMVKNLVDLGSPSPEFTVEMPTLNARFTVGVAVLGEGDAESLTLRMHPEGEGMRRLDALGLVPEQAELLKKALQGGKGMIAVASPPEMGARTTVYALLDSIDPYSRNIVTFERPVTGSLASIEQNDLNEMAEPLGEVLKARLRQDYDLMMVSEVPDKPTALAGLTAVQREQVFLARLELPDAVSVVRYLVKLGVEPSAVAAGLHTVVGQRLVRVLCRECRRKVAPSESLLRKIHVDPAKVEFLWEESSGCEACGMTGFHGRTGVFEVWKVGEEGRRVIAAGAGAAKLRAAARADGMASLQQAGLVKVLEGVTSLRELARVLKVGT